MNQITLHHYWRSSCSWRVRWALELKGLTWHAKPVNLLKNEQQTSAYTQKNPAACVPCLEYRGEFLADSIAIIEWLDETFPGHSLFPTSPSCRAKVRQLVGIIASGTQPIQNLWVLKELHGLGQDRAKWAADVITRGLGAYETVLQRTSGTFSYGGQITAADLCLVPQVYNAHRFNVDMQKFPISERIYQHCLTLKSCDQAAPHNQDGAQP